MKSIFFLLLTLLMWSCTQNYEERNQLQHQIIEQKAELNQSYKPGFGEFMINVQLHHSKLWFAGQARNWKLAEFELEEINETIEDLKTYQSQRKEIQVIGMIVPALDSVKSSIKHQNLADFNQSFTLLTNTCNTCHRATNHEFIHIKTPDKQIFSNQEFDPEK